MPETPDLNELSHAEFDARLVQTWQPRYPWTRSLLPEDPSMGVAPDAFRQHAQRALLAYIRTQRGQAGYQDGRAALEYAAFELVDASAKVLHLRQRPLKELAERFRRDMLLCLRSNELSTYHAWSPRWKKGMQRPHGGSVVSWDEPLTSKWDKQALESLAGGHTDREADHGPALDRVGEMLQQVTPNLATIDTGSLEIRQQEWRARMWDVLDQGMHMDHGTILRPEAREAMLDQSLDGLLEELPPTIEGDIAEDVQRELFRKQRHAELLQLNPGQIDALLLRRTQLQLFDASRDKKILMILNSEMRNSAIAKPEVRLIDPPAGSTLSGADFVRQVGSQLLETPMEGEMNAEKRATIAKRMRILAYHASVATHELQRANAGEEGADADDAIARLNVLQQLFQTTITAAKIDWQDMPFFAHLKFILGSQMESVNPRELRSFL